MRFLTHTAGLRTNYSSDPIRGIRNDIVMPRVAHSNHFFDYLVAAEADNSNGRTDYSYSNISYLLLGLVIEVVSGQPYAASCQNEIFARLGVGAYIPQRCEVLAPFNGWFLTIADVLKVWRVLDINNPTLLHRSTLTNILLGKIAPTQSGADEHYTMGTRIRANATNTSYVIRHNGISDFYGLHPTYYALVQATVPGTRWAFAVSPIVDRDRQQLIYQELTEFMGRTTV